MFSDQSPLRNARARHFNVSASPHIRTESCSKGRRTGYVKGSIPHEAQEIRGLGEGIKRQCTAEKISFKSHHDGQAYYNIKEQIGGSALSLPQDMNPQLADENNEQVVSGAPNVGNGYALTNFEADNDNSYRRGGETRKRHCVYTKETNITKTIGRPMTRVGAEPHKQWFPGDSSLYFQRNLATGARAESVGAYCNEGNLNQDLQREKQYRQLDRASRRDVEPENRVTQRQTNRRQGDIGDTQRGGLAGETNMKFPPQSGKSFQQLQTARRPPEHCFVPSVPSSSRQANTSSFFDQQVLTSGGDNAGKYGARW